MGKSENKGSNPGRPLRGEASPRRRLLLRPIQASDRGSPPAGRADSPSTQEGERRAAHARGTQGSTASCLLTILAAVVYWQIREIERVRGEIDPEDDGPVELLAHISPISWDNVVLYGEYTPRPELVETETPELYRIRLHVSACYPRMSETASGTRNERGSR